MTAKSIKIIFLLLFYLISDLFAQDTRFTVGLKASRVSNIDPSKYYYMYNFCKKCKKKYQNRRLPFLNFRIKQYKAVVS